MPEVEITETPPDVLNDGTLVVAYDIKDAFRAPEKMTALIKHVEREIAAAGPVDTTTEDGRKAAKSLAYKVARSKTAIDDVGFKLVEHLKKTVAAVDRERKRCRDALDGFAAAIRKPVLDFERAEAERVTRLAAAVNAIYVTLPVDADAASVELEISRLEDLVIDESWAEREDEAERIRTSELIRLRGVHDRMVQREAEMAELNRLRAEAAERERQEAERAEAEARAKAEAERKEREERIAKEAAEAAAKATAEAAAAAVAAAQAEAAAAEQRAKDTEAAAERRAQAAAEAAKRQAEQEAAAQRRREAEQAEAARRAQEKRERNLRLRNAIKREIAEDLRKLGCGTDAPIVATALMEGQVRHCRVEFSQ